MKAAIRLRIRWIVRLMIRLMVRWMVRFMGMLFLSFWVIAVFHQSVRAGEIRVYTLDECVKEALRNNWELKAKKEQIDQAEYVKNQARAEFLPKLSTSYGYKRYGLNQEIFTSRGPFEMGSKNNYQWITISFTEIEIARHIPRLPFPKAARIPILPVCRGQF